MLVRTAKVLKVQPSDLLPTSDAPPLPEAAHHLSLRGAEELLTAWAGIESARRRRAVLHLVRTLRDEPDDVAQA